MNQADTDAIKRLWAVLGMRQRRSIGKLFLYSLLSSAAELGLLATIMPFAMALSTYGARAAGTSATLYHSGLIVLLAIAVTSSMRLFTLRLQANATKGIAEYLSVRSYGRTLNRPYIAHIGDSVSQLTATLTGRLDNVFTSVIIAAAAGLSQLALSVAIVLGLFLTSPLVTAVVLASVVGAYALFLHRARTLVRRESERHNSAVSKVTSILSESLVGIRDVLLAGTQAKWLGSYREAQHELRDANAKLAFTAATPRVLVEALGFAVIVIAACVLAATMSSAAAPVSILAVVILGAQRLLPNAQGLYFSWNSLKGGLPQLREVLPLLEQPDHARTPAGPALPLRESLELRGLRFAYPGAAAPVVENADLKIRAGSIVGIIGRTGSGKSTLLDLIMGLLSADAGALLLDGKPLTQADIPQWQRSISHVAQHIHLADATIAENIGLGDAEPELDRARMEKAAQLAQIADFIAALPLGYQTPVGDRGVRLSGGQRQRIGIARALYRHNDFLILDEGTSALDGETEQHVLDALVAAPAQTILIVTHRVSTLRLCDAIYRMREGVLEGPIPYAALTPEISGADA